MNKLKGRLPALALTGSPSLALSDVAWTAKIEGEALRELRFVFDVPWDVWVEIDRAAAFHLAPDARGKVFGGELTAGKPVRIEAILGTKGFTLLGVMLDDPEVLGETLCGPELASIRTTDAWYAMYVSQEVSPGLRTGFQTRWAAA
jgi:hypothetical protein